MAISIGAQPDKWSSVYRPIEFAFRSDLYPNVTLGDTSIPIIDITQDAYGVRVRISAQLFTAPLSVGESISITGTDYGYYEGAYRVTSTYESGGLLIAYIAATYIGEDYNGTAGRFYPDLNVVVKVTYSASGETVTYYLDKDADDDLFKVNIEDASARQFIRVFDQVAADTPWATVVDSDASIAQEYTIQVYERWTQWEDGAPSVVDNSKDAQKIKGFRAVNCVHPYHKDEDGVVTFDWSDNLQDAFVLSNGSTGARFLTWSRQQDRKAALGDPLFVSFLCEMQSPITTVSVFVTTYAASGTPIGVLDSGQLDASFANTVNVGPSGFLSIINEFVDYYTVRILDRNGSVLTEALRVNIDRTCAEVNRRIYWRNKLGGIDQYTMKGRETEFPSVARSTLRRTNGRLMARDSTGTWMERTHMAEPVRRHVLTSELIGTRTLKWLNDDAFESSDIATIVSTPMWTNMVPLSVDGQPTSTRNDNARFIIEYYYGMDNRSQRA